MQSATRLALLSTLLLATSSLADPAEVSLRVRAQTLLDGITAARTPEQRGFVRDALVAISDTLEAAGEAAVASQCLEVAGQLWFRAGALDEARDAWRRGLDLARESGDRSREAALLNANAIVSSATGDYQGGIARFGELVVLRRELDDTRGEAIAWTNLATCYGALFRVPEALQSSSTALPLHRESGNARGVAVSFTQAGNMLIELGRYDAALVMMDSALAQPGMPQWPDVFAGTIGDTGRLLHLMGQPDAGLALIDSSIALYVAEGAAVEAARKRVSRAHALIALARYQEALATLDAALVVLDRAGDGVSALGARAMRPVALLGLGRTTDAEREAIALLAGADSLQAAQSDGDTRASVFRVAGVLHADVASLRAIEGRHHEAWQAIERGQAASLRYAIGGADDAVSLPTVRARLADDNAALLQWSEATGTGFVVVVMTADSVHSVLVNSRDPAAELGIASRLLASGAPDASSDGLLARSAADILAPVAEFLGPRLARVYIAPATWMEGAPVEALPLAAYGGEALGSRFVVTRVPSASVLGLLAARVPAARGMVAFADPTTRPQHNADVTPSRLRSVAGVPLPEARSEARRIAVRGARVYVGADAVKQAYRAPSCRTAGVIHFATHALVDPVRPEKSAVVLAGAREDSVMLTAEEIERDPIVADLVTLSGCRTAGGHTYFGEGTFGVSRAFMVAGARSVVMSLWDVDDVVARRFMEVFYSGLRRGEPRDTALRAARVQLLQGGSSRRDAYAFVLAGVGAEPVAAIYDPPRGPVTAPVAVLGVLIIAGVIGWMRRSKSIPGTRTSR